MRAGSPDPCELWRGGGAPGGHGDQRISRKRRAAGDVREEGPLPGVKGQSDTEFLRVSPFHRLELVVSLPWPLHSVLHQQSHSMEGTTLSLLCVYLIVDDAVKLFGVWSCPPAWGEVGGLGQRHNVGGNGGGEHKLDRFHQS